MREKTTRTETTTRFDGFAPLSNGSIWVGWQAAGEIRQSRLHEQSSRFGREYGRRRGASDL